MSTSTSRAFEQLPIIDPATRMGPVNLTVADLDRQLSFYQDVLGFKLHWREGAQAGVGAGREDLVQLVQVADARRVHGTTGLYHTAILVPSKWELAHILRRIGETRTRLQGLTDHRTHLALYLADAEGNGLELAWDFPREQWPTDTQGKPLTAAASGPLEPQDLFAELERDPSPWAGAHAETRVGHVHLRVTDLATTKRFYHGTLGFDVTMDLEQYGALFFSAGGYHHHLATNVWGGVGAPPPPADAVGLRHFSIVLPGQAALERVLDRVRAARLDVQTLPEGALLSDPSRNGVLLTIASAS